MIEDIKLSGIVTDNGQTFGQSAVKDTTDVSTLCGYFDMSMIYDLQLCQMGFPFRDQGLFPVYLVL